MVLGQVGEEGDLVVDRVTAVEGERVQETSIAHARSPPSSIRLKVAWRSIASGVVRSTSSSAPPTTCLHGAEQAAPDPGRLEHLADQERGRRLAVCPSHPRDPQLGGRVAPEPGRDRRHRRPRVGDEDLRHLQLEPALDDEGRGPGLERRRRELVAVGPLADDAEEERPVGDPPAVVCQPADLDAGVAGDLGTIEPSDQLSEFQRGRF